MLDFTNASSTPGARPLSLNDPEAIRAAVAAVLADVPADGGRSEPVAKVIARRLQAEHGLACEKIAAHLRSLAVPELIIGKVNTLLQPGYSWLRAVHVVIDWTMTGYPADRQSALQRLVEEIDHEFRDRRPDGSNSYVTSDGEQQDLAACREYLQRLRANDDVSAREPATSGGAPYGDTGASAAQPPAPGRQRRWCVMS